MENRIGLGRQSKRISKAACIQRLGCAALLAVAVLGMPRISRSDDRPSGYLYTVNNDLQQNGVAVLQQNADGSLKEVAGSPFKTGGKGLGGGDIDQQGAIRIYGN